MPAIVNPTQQPMDEGQLRRLVELGTISAEQAAELEQQMAMAKGLREGAPSLAGTQAGRVYVAPNIMSGIAAGIGGYQANQAEQAALRAGKAGRAATGQQNAMLLAALLRGQQAAPQAPTVPPRTVDPYAPLRRNEEDAGGYI